MQQTISEAFYCERELKHNNLMLGAHLCSSYTRRALIKPHYSTCVDSAHNNSTLLCAITKLLGPSLITLFGDCFKCKLKSHCNLYLTNHILYLIYQSEHDPRVFYLILICSRKQDAHSLHSLKVAVFTEAPDVVKRCERLKVQRST